MARAALCFLIRYNSNFCNLGTGSFEKPCSKKSPPNATLVYIVLVFLL